MLEPIVNFFDKLVDQFTWRRLVLLAVLLAIAASSIWGYERYTQQFKLARIEKQISLMEKLSSLANNEAVRENTTLKSLQGRIETQLKETTDVEKTEYEIEPWVKKSLAAAAAWIIFGICIAFIPNSYTSTQPAATSVISGMLVFASPFIAAAAWLPTNPWLNYAIYPIGHIFALVFAMLFFGLWLGRKFRPKAAQ